MLHLSIHNDDGTALFSINISAKQYEDVVAALNQKPANNDYCQRIICNFNEICISAPTVCKLTASRRRAIEQAHKEYDLEMIFHKVNNSPFLCGENERNWVADFDWILKPANLIKIFEGKFDARKSQKNSSFDVSEIDRMTIDEYRRAHG